jgi:tRNA threonylcarbamoyladenosine biosynthesis protein TsaB
VLILTIRTDQPDAEVGIFADDKQLCYQTWLAHRQLSVTIHQTINKQLKKINQNLNDIQGIVVYKGPGSFTGLRIGCSVANALAYSLAVPIVVTSGQDWLKQGLTKLASGENQKLALPEYGAPVHTTEQKH